MKFSLICFCIGKRIFFCKYVCFKISLVFGFYVSLYNNIDIICAGSVSTQVKNQPMKALPLKPADQSEACSSSGDKLLSNQNAAISKVELKPRRTHSLEEKSTEEKYVGK